MPGVHGPQCGCVHETDLKGAQFLLPYINLEGIRGLNEQVQNSARTIFKSYEDRLDETKFCRSEEDDPELMIHIPFKSPCKISSLHLIGGDNGRSPASVKIYADQENLDFSTVHDTPCIQEVELVTDFHGAVEYPLKVTKLQNVTCLTLFFPQNMGGDFLELFYIGLRGEGSNYQRRAVVTVYEANANPADHEVASEHGVQATALEEGN
ncbi:thioredoxin family Trp26 protein [Toxoplasma gondii TgCatPRC2]|uniref:Thioredoxin family Trp26 protein n=3 Tax=Toxoplasma gondii TaxID=5811 RepID=A0A151HJV6_TOXGO|nr:thioredoxin family Trp26 protein [Toxoplasma gondii ARI]KYK69626.1 thioredoxin family Trp26 protein [Toxoplasma gondii TgCatPRC2]PIM01602.1 thioredoxin family Trp26 protein [Toxoplasma gondii COUG]